VSLEAAVLEQRAQAETKAWKALAGYKFLMFGYHAAGWVRANHLLPRALRSPSPFRSLVHAARARLAS
jgi:hypothetical protein